VRWSEEPILEIGFHQLLRSTPLVLEGGGARQGLGLLAYALVAALGPAQTGAPVELRRKQGRKEGAWVSVS